jgi:HlyD family secretion protein
METTAAPIPAVSPPIIAAFSPPKKTKKKRKLVIFIIIGVVVIMAAAGVAVRSRKPPISVQTEKVTRRNITEIVVANGKIQPVTQVLISPEVAGEIIALPVKEGDDVKKGDLLVQIKPDNYQATRDSDEASYKSALANVSLAKAQLEKAEIEYKRNQELFQHKLISDSDFLTFKTEFDVAKLQVETATHQVDQAKFTLNNADADLKKTTILSPINGTVVKLNSHLGERVLGTSFNMGTEIMTVADLSEIEARVDVGEMDVVLMKPGQNAHLEVDAFKDRKFNGIVTEVADSANGFGQSAAAASMSGGGGSSSTGGDATKFEVHIRLKEKEQFRPGMSASAEIETRLRTNVLSVPIASVTARMPKPVMNTNDPPAKTNLTASSSSSNSVAMTNSAQGTNYVSRADKKAEEANKQIDVVFVLDGDHVKMIPVKIGISDDNYWEVTDGLQEGQEVISGGYHAISHDLEDGKKVVKGKGMPGDAEKKPM